MYVTYMFRYVALSLQIDLRLCWKNLYNTIALQFDFLIVVSLLISSTRVHIDVKCVIVFIMTVKVAVMPKNVSNNTSNLEMT